MTLTGTNELKLKILTTKSKSDRFT